MWLLCSIGTNLHINFVPCTYYMYMYTSATILTIRRTGILKEPRMCGYYFGARNVLRRGGKGGSMDCEVHVTFVRFLLLCSYPARIQQIADGTDFMLLERSYESVKELLTD